MKGAVSMELLGADDFKERLSEFMPRQARNIIRATVQALASKVRDELRANVTKNTHALEKSIRSVRRNPQGDNFVSEVRGGSTAPYMLMLEFGTSKTKAQPFIVPTVERMRPDMPRFYREEFGKKFVAAVARDAKLKSKGKL